MSSAGRRRLTAAAGLVASLAGLPLLLAAAAGPPAVGGLPSWRWVTDGLRDQYLPVEPLLAVLGVLAWALWAYAVLVAVLRVVAVAAARRGIGGSAGLLTFSNLVTVAPLRSLVDAAVGVSLLASAPHAVAAPAVLASPPAVVRTLETPAGWDAPPRCWALSTPTPPSPHLVDQPDRRISQQRLGQPRSATPNARPEMAGCIRWRRGTRCGGSPNASWATATAGGRSSPSTRDAGWATASC